MTVLQQAIEACAAAGEDFWASAMVIAHRGGLVFIEPEFVCVVQRESPDTLYVWLYVGRGGLAKVCERAPAGTRWLKWQRGIRLADKAKVRQFDFQRVKRLASLSSPSPHVLQTAQSCPASCGGDSLGGNSAPGDDHDGAKPVH